MSAGIKLGVAALLCALAALALYFLTLSPTFGWGDSADLALRMIDSGDRTFDGSSRDYALYRWVGGLFQLVPLGDAGTRANLMAAFFGAVTVGIAAWTSGYVARSIFAACAAGAALMVSHSFWLMSVIAEVYTFNAALIFACYALLALWWRSAHMGYFVAAAFAAGLALAHHSTGLLLAATAVPLVLLRIRSLSLRGVVMAALVFIAAASVYWQQAAVLLLDGAALLQVLGLVTPTNPFFDISPLRELVKFIAYAGYNFFGFAALLALWGIAFIWRQRIWEMLPALLWMGLMIGAGITASIPDKFNIYVLVYPVFAICTGVGAARVNELFLRNKMRALAALLLCLVIIPPLGYLAAIHAMQRLGIDLVGARAAPYRDNAWYFMWPPKNGDVAPRRYAQEALQAVDHDAVLIADYTLWRPLYFMQVIEGVRPDVTLQWVEKLAWHGSIADYIATLPCSRSVYLAANTPAEYYQLADITKRYTLQQAGVVFKIIRLCHRL